MGFNRNIKGFNLSAVVPKWSISEPISLLPPMDVLQGEGSFGRSSPTLKCGTFGPYIVKYRKPQMSPQKYTHNVFGSQNHFYLSQTIRKF